MKALPHALDYEKTIVVTPELCVPAMAGVFPGFEGMPEVFATAKMIALIEVACVEALAPYLEPGERSVGTAVNVTHTAATGVGMRVTVRVKLSETNGRRLLFEVECRDEKEAIGVGQHERAIVELDRFLNRIDQKRR